MKKNKNDSDDKDNHNNSKDNTSPQSDITFSSSRQYRHKEKNKESIDNEEHDNDDEEAQGSEQKQDSNVEESEVDEEEEEEQQSEVDEEEQEKDEGDTHIFQFKSKTKASLIKQLSELNSKYNSIENELALSKNEINKFETIISSKNTIITEFQKLVQGSIIKLGIMEETNMALNKTIEENEAKTQLLTKAEEEYKSQIEKYGNMTKELQLEIEKQKKKSNHYNSMSNLKQLSNNKSQFKAEANMKMTEADYEDKLSICKDTIYRLERELQAVCMEIKEYKNEINKLNHILYYYEDIIKISNKKIWDKDTIIRIHNEDNDELLKKQVDFDQYKAKSNKKVDRMYQKLLAIDEEKYSLLRENDVYNKEIATLKYKSSCDNGNKNYGHNYNELIRLQLDKEELEFKLRNVITSLKVFKDSIDKAPLSSSCLSNGGYYPDTNKYCVTLVKGIEDIIAQIEPTCAAPFYVKESLHSPHRSITPTPTQTHTALPTTHSSKHNKNMKSSNHSFTYEYSGRNSYI